MGAVGEDVKHRRRLLLAALEQRVAVNRLAVAVFRQVSVAQILAVGPVAGTGEDHSLFLADVAAVDGQALRTEEIKQGIDERRIDLRPVPAGRYLDDMTDQFEHLCAAASFWPDKVARIIAKS